MELVYPEMFHESDALDFVREHTDAGEKHIHGSGGLLQTLKTDGYAHWLASVAAAREKPGYNFTGSVPASTYFAIVGGRIVGTIQIRHELNEYLLNAGGHIGYGVRPSDRWKGYGTAMLSLALKKCAGLKIKKALVTCDKINAASAKTIIKNGGVLENEIIDEHGETVQRYWINIAEK